jgi:hypothetical protein
MASISIPDMIDRGIRMVQDICTYLDIPTSHDVWTASREAWKESGEAIQSISHLSILVGRPFVLATWWILLHGSRFLWKYVIVEGIYNHGLSQSKEAAIVFWQFQLSLSRKGLLIEAGIAGALIALFLFLRWLQRNRYIQRVRQFTAKQCNRASNVSFM